MKISDRFIMALRNLWRRKSRTILTILSVVIGSTSIILMLAFAQGISNSQKEMIESFQGLSTIEVMDGSGQGQLEINDKVLNELKRVSHVKAVVPSKNIYTQIKMEDTEEYEIDGSLSVIPDNIISMIDQEMLEMGKVVSPNDDNKIILGQNTSASKIQQMNDGYYSEPVEDFDYNAHQYYIQLGWMDEEEDDGVNFGNDNNNNPEDPESEQAKKPATAKVPIEIAGKLNNKSFLTGWGSYISEATYKRLKKEDEKIKYPSLGGESYDDKGNPIVEKSDKITYESLQVIVDDVKNVEQSESEIRKLGYQTNSMAQANEEIAGQTQKIMLILGGIGSIAFIVSAIGIINTMLMSIYERQKEIGVMKVIGASVSDIQTMFLIESGFIGFFGGVLGLLISLLVGRLINKLLAGGDNMFGMSTVVIIPIWLALVGVGFSALVGVLAGYLPARRATKLSAIDALRAN